MSTLLPKQWIQTVDNSWSVTACLTPVGSTDRGSQLCAKVIQHEGINTKAGQAPNCLWVWEDGKTWVKYHAAFSSRIKIRDSWQSREHCKSVFFQCIYNIIEQTSLLMALLHTVDVNPGELNSQIFQSGQGGANTTKWQCNLNRIPLINH